MRAASWACWLVSTRCVLPLRFCDSRAVSWSLGLLLRRARLLGRPFALRLNDPRAMVECVHLPCLYPNGLANLILNRSTTRATYVFNTNMRFEYEAQLLTDCIDQVDGTLRKRPWPGQLGHRGGCDGHRGGTIIPWHFSSWQDSRLSSFRNARILIRLCVQEFSIEIPDKDADAIHSGMSTCYPRALPPDCILIPLSLVDKAVEYILNQPDAH